MRTPDAGQAPAPTIRDAHDAHRAGDSRRALATLIAAWRLGSSTRLGDAIVQYGRRFPVEGEVPAPHDPTTVEKWVRKTKSAADGMKRLRALHAAWGPDPRLLDVLIGLLRPRVHARSDKFQELVFELIEAQGDPRMFPALQGVPELEEWRDDVAYGHVPIQGAKTHNRRLAELFELHFEPGWQDPPLDRADRLRLQKMLGEVAEDPREIKLRRELWQKVVAKPRDLTPRLVYADHLTQAGDPRGAFILLQVAHAAGELDAAGQARMEELLAAHRERWFGRIEPALSLKPEHLRWGFLDVARISASRPAILQSCGGSREWNLVREAQLSSASHLDVLLDPAFKRLVTVRGVDRVEQAAALSFVHPGLRELFVSGTDDPDPGTEHGCGFVRLRTLGITPRHRAHVPWFVQHLREPLKLLELDWREDRIAEAMSWLVEDRVHAARTALRIHPGGSSRAEVQTRPGREGWDLAVELRGNVVFQRAVLAALPEGRVRVVRSTNADVRREAGDRYPGARVDRA